MDADKQLAIYEQLAALVRTHVPDDFAISEAPGRLEVNTRREVVIDGRKHPFLNLLSIINQKHHVGFYFMPVYVDERLQAELSPTLAKMLKGKSCFHCKQTLSPELHAEIAALIDSGVDLYRRREWV